MEYRFLGNSGLKVSALSLGSWATYGVKSGEEECAACMEIAYKAGINFFDNAEVYGKNRGDAETIMGNVLAKFNWPRESYVLSTKLFWGGDGVNEKGLSRKHLLAGMNASLKRLQVDYVDLVFAHRPDSLTPMEEVVRAFTKIVQDGKALYWGTSEWSAQQITEAHWIARYYNLIPPTMEQPQYNMFHRERVEKEYAPLYRAPYGIGTTIWSPLASGILTGKYNEGIPEGSRLAQPGYEFLRKKFEEVQADRIPRVQKLAAIAAELGGNVAQLAIAWCMKFEHVSTVILGASKPEQLEDNLKALELYKKLDDSMMDRIEDVLENAPDAEPTWGRE